jgi:hypothetical protein
MVQKLIVVIISFLVLVCAPAYGATTHKGSWDMPQEVTAKVETQVIFPTFSVVVPKGWSFKGSESPPHKFRALVLRPAGIEGYSVTIGILKGIKEPPLKERLEKAKANPNLKNATLDKWNDQEWLFYRQDREAPAERTWVYHTYWSGDTYGISALAPVSASEEFEHQVDSVAKSVRLGATE